MEQAEVVIKLALANGAIPDSIEALTDKTECSKLWRLRKECLWSAMAANPDREPMITDVCVPLSKLPEMLNKSRQIIDSAAMKLPGPTVAHAGDGNSHVLLFFKPDDPAEVSEAKRVARELADMAISLNGTCTGDMPCVEAYSIIFLGQYLIVVNYLYINLHPYIHYIN